MIRSRCQRATRESGAENGAARFPGPRVGRRLGSGTRLQPKLEVTPASDPLEAEADRIAEQVLRGGRVADRGMASSTAGSERLQRQGDREDDEEETGDVTASVMSQKRVPGAPGAPRSLSVTAAQAIPGPGQALPAGERGFFEDRFGHDFGRVRVHTDERAAEAARAFEARAYTVGRDIVFGRGQYSPRTEAGRRLMAHELTHVIQQGRGEERIMRACDCSAAGARNPVAAEQTFLQGHFPNLTSGEWCVTGPRTPTYNCIAWTVGDSSSWIWNQVDNPYGDRDGTVEISDFDSFYRAHHLQPITDRTEFDPEANLYAQGTTPQHASVRSARDCGSGVPMQESKLGENLRILHRPHHLEGGSYGDVVRQYELKA